VKATPNVFFFFSFSLLNFFLKKKCFNFFRGYLGTLVPKTPRALHMGLFLSGKMNLSNRWITLKIFKTWLQYIVMARLRPRARIWTAPCMIKQNSIHF
jgi:hypothetical protein